MTNVNVQYCGNELVVHHYGNIIDVVSLRHLTKLLMYCNVVGMTEMMAKRR
jgi:hypothetical protein